MFGVERQFLAIGRETRFDPRTQVVQRTFGPGIDHLQVEPMLHRDVLSVRRDIEARADEALARLDAVQVLEGDGPERPGVRRKSNQHEDEAQNGASPRSEEHTSELQSLMRIQYAVFCLKKKKN